MSVRGRVLIGIGSALSAVLLIKLLMGNSVVALLQPRGVIAQGSLHTIMWTAGLMLTLALPVIGAFVYVLWKYRAGNSNAAYVPKAARKGHEALLWLVPFLLVMVLWVITWKSTHQLDPYAPIPSDKPPITIQVIALPWKWLFIYPDERIATVNEIAFPVGTPVHFDLTADGPISAFWIPQLGSQIYAMGAMQTQLNLMATHVGKYAGKNTEINGDGFSGMTFTAKAMEPDEYRQWLAKIQLYAPEALDMEAYHALAKPSADHAPSFYASVEAGLFDTVVMKDMMPPSRE